MPPLPEAWFSKSIYVHTHTHTLIYLVVYPQDQKYEHKILKMNISQLISKWPEIVPNSCLSTHESCHLLPKIHLKRASAENKAAQEPTALVSREGLTDRIPEIYLPPQTSLPWVHILKDFNLPNSNYQVKFIFQIFLCQIFNCGSFFFFSLISMRTSVTTLTDRLSL